MEHSQVECSRPRARVRVGLLVVQLVQQLLDLLLGGLGDDQRLYHVGHAVLGVDVGPSGLCVFELDIIVISCDGDKVSCPGLQFVSGGETSGVPRTVDYVRIQHLSQKSWVLLDMGHELGMKPCECPVGWCQESNVFRFIHLVIQTGVTDEVNNIGVLRTTILDLRDDRTSAVVHGGHHTGDDVEDAVPGMVVHAHDGLTVSSHHGRLLSGVNVDPDESLREE